MKCGLVACFCFKGVWCHTQSTEVKQNDMWFSTTNFGLNISVCEKRKKLIQNYD